MPADRNLVQLFFVDTMAVATAVRPNNSRLAASVTWQAFQDKKRGRVPHGVL